MKTAHYTFTTCDEAMAAGFDRAADGPRRTVMVRCPEQVRAAGEDKVIDLTAWRAANLDELWDDEADADWDSGEASCEAEPPVIPAPRPRKSRRAMLTAELVSTLSVVAAALALILRVLTF